MTLESNKSLGGIGAILMAIGVLPFLGFYTGIVSLIGLVLVLIAVKGLSDYYKDARIFNNVLYGIVTAIVGVVVVAVMVATAAIGLLKSYGITNWTDWAAFQNIDWTKVVNLDVIWPYIAVILLSLVLLFVFAVVTAIFLRRSLNVLSDKTKVGMFGTTGLMLLIGAILTIVLIGFLLLWIALILLAVAFFTIPVQPAQPLPTSAGPVQQ